MDRRIDRTEEEQAEPGSRPDLPAADASPRAESDEGQPHAFYRYAIPIGAAVFITVWATPTKLAKLPLQAVLKDRLFASPEETATFFFVVGAALYLKPLAGVLSDRVRLFGTRRRHYVIVSALVGIALWMVASATAGSFWGLLVAVAALSMALMIGNTAVNGMLVEIARRRSAEDRLSAVRVNVMNLASLAAGPVGGWLAGPTMVPAAGAGGLLLGALALCARWFPPEETPARTPSKGARGELFDGMRSRTLWIAALLTFVFYIPPGLNTMLYYYQKETLLLDDQEIGFLMALNCGGGLVGGLVYPRLGRKLGFRRALVAGILAHATCWLFYVAYQSRAAAYLIEPTVGFLEMLGLLPVQAAAVRAAPRGTEALGFAIILGVGNFAIHLNEVIGTRMAATFHLSVQELAVVAAATSTTAVVVIPFLRSDAAEHPPVDGHSPAS